MWKKKVYVLVSLFMSEAEEGKKRWRSDGIDVQSGIGEKLKRETAHF